MGLFKTDEEKKQEHIKKGLDYANSNDYDRAVKEFENALKLFPKDEDALFNLGFVYADMQQYGPAYDIFKKLVNINPHHIEAFNNLGLLFARQGKYTDAVSVYEKGVEHNPGAAVLYNNLGNVYYDTGKYEKALQMFKKAGDLDPVFSERLYHLGIDSFIKGSGGMDDAIAKLQESVKQNVNKAKTVHDLGVAYLERHMEDKAIDSFIKALNIDPNYLSAYVNLGYTYQHKESYEKAIQSFEKALILNPKSAKLYNTIGLIYDKIDKPDIAVKMYKKAVSLDPTYANSHYMLGQLYQNRGSVDKSVAEFTKHIRIHETGNMVEDAMQRIAGMKSMTFENVKQLFSLYIDKKPEGMSKQSAPPPPMEEKDEKDYMKNLKDKMTEKKTAPPPAPPLMQQTSPAAPAKLPEPAASPAKVIDPNEYMKLMKEKMKKKLAGEAGPDAALNPEKTTPVPLPAPAFVVPPPPPPMTSQHAPVMPVSVPQPVFEVINDNSPSNNIIDLPPRPEDNPWFQPNIIEARLGEPVANSEYKHIQEGPEKPAFDSGPFQLPSEDYMETNIKPADGSELPDDNIPEFKKPPVQMPVIPVEPVHGTGIYNVGAISPIQASGSVPLAPRHPMTPQGPHKPPSVPDSAQEPPHFKLKKDDNDNKPKITRNYY
jgi:tetratricopeptide (TPR) repeat protein